MQCNMFLLKFCYGFRLPEYFVCANALCVHLARGLKLPAKHYDLLKIYTENTLQTDKNHLQTTNVYANQIVCGRSSSAYSLFTSFTWRFQCTPLWFNLNISTALPFPQSRLLIPSICTHAFARKCNATSPDNQSVFDSVLVRANWFQTKHSCTHSPAITAHFQLFNKIPFKVSLYSFAMFPCVECKWKRSTRQAHLLHFAFSALDDMYSNNAFEWARENTKRPINLKWNIY